MLPELIIFPAVRIGNHKYECIYVPGAQLTADPPQCCRRTLKDQGAHYYTFDHQH